jgi:hypothetical protein
LLVLACLSDHLRILPGFFHDVPRFLPEGLLSDTTSRPPNH